MFAFRLCFVWVALSTWFTIVICLSQGTQVARAQELQSPLPASPASPTTLEATGEAEVSEASLDQLFPGQKGLVKEMEKAIRNKTLPH